MTKIKRIYLIINLVAAFIQAANGAKILFFMGIATHSHRIALQPLALKLLEAGHQISFFTVIPPEVPNPKITEFFPESARKAVAGSLDTFAVDVVNGRLTKRFYDPVLSPSFTWDLVLPTLELTLLNPEFDKWQRESHYDLIIYDSPCKDIGAAIAYKMKAKVISFVTTSKHFTYDQEMYGLPFESSWLPDISPGSQYWFLPHHFARAYNAIYWYLSYKWNFLPKVDAILERVYKEKLPPLEEIIRGVDLVFLNEHWSFNFPRTLPPFVIPVGGMHCREADGVLSKKLQTFLDTKDRFVYISFGSYLKISNLPREAQKMWFEALGTLQNTNFLLKFDEDPPEGVPPNVFIQKWFPQQNVLAHPKCKGFITQGGAMSFQQAVFHGVPMIVVPLAGDQNYVAYSVTYQGNGMHVELADINKDSLPKILGELLNNEKYFKMAQEISKRTKDRPMSPIDTAVWWTEYVLRHDTSHLKSPGINQYWWQRQLLDFWLMTFLTLLFFIYLTHTMLRNFITQTASNFNAKVSHGKKET